MLIRTSPFIRFFWVRKPRPVSVKLYNCKWVLMPNHCKSSSTSFSLSLLIKIHNFWLNFYKLLFIMQTLVRSDVFDIIIIFVILTCFRLAIIFFEKKISECWFLQTKWQIKVEKILKGSLDLIPSPSPSVKIQIMGGKVCLRYKGKTLLDIKKPCFFDKKWTHLLGAHVYKIIK